MVTKFKVCCGFLNSRKLLLNCPLVNMKKVLILISLFKVAFSHNVENIKRNILDSGSCTLYLLGEFRNVTSMDKGDHEKLRFFHFIIIMFAKISKLSYCKTK